LVIEYRIHPSVGVARVGNSTKFYLPPTTVGGRPTECDQLFGDEIDGDKPKYVKKFKDEHKKMKRQAAKFTVYKHDTDNNSVELVDLTNQNEIKGVKWMVHIANKKAAWYHFDLFKGDLLIDPENTYENRNAEKRNPDVEDEKRQKLIIDFGPRTMTSPKSRKPFKYCNVPPGYKHAHLPLYTNGSASPKFGRPIRYLGEAITNSKNDLLVLGGYGLAGGDEEFGTFAGGNGWYDDMSDGPVVCEIELTENAIKKIGDKSQLKDGKITLDAWVIVAPPKVAPELVNITTLDDIMLDVAVRHLNVEPKIFDGRNWGKYSADYYRDIKPIVKRMGHYRWVANLPSMMDFCMPSFDMENKEPEAYDKRKKYYDYFRKPADEEWQRGGKADRLFSGKNEEDDYINGIPLMPLNAGSNAVNNEIIDKFVELSRTQHYFLEQWAEGNFTKDEMREIIPGMIPLDHADVGNCVGAPMCPGVEVTWSIRNPSIYSGPFRIKHRKKITDYYDSGLEPLYDETKPLKQKNEGQGCEPGDLTKRMACPWQSDLFECNIQHINFTDKNKNATTRLELEEPPTYHAYWWPPQSPWDVILGVTDPNPAVTDLQSKKYKVIEELSSAGASAGQQVNYIRGIQNHVQMVYAWSYLGFIVNQNEDDDRDEYPYFVEKERNHDEFGVVGLAANNKINIVDPESTRFIPGYYLKKDIVEFTKSEE